VLLGHVFSIRTLAEQTVKVGPSGRHAGATEFWHPSEKPGNAWFFLAPFGTAFGGQSQVLFADKA
jgi:hypothetical protein